MSGKRVLLVALGIAVGTGVVVVLGTLGVPVEFAAAWLLLIVAVGVLSGAGHFDEPSWPPPRPERPPRGSEVSRLGWSINSRTGVAGLVIVRRVQRVLRRRLSHLGLDLDDASQNSAVDAVLGAGVREIFTRPVVTRSDLEHVMAAIDRLPPPTNQER